MSSGAFSLFLFGSLLSTVLATVALTAIMFGENRTIDLQHQIRLANLESESRGAQIRALQAQIDPHFMHNTLTAIVALVKLHRTEAALTCMQAFSGMLRHKYRMGQTVTLEQEISYVKNYIIIQSVRYGDELTTTWDVDSELYNLRIPSLVIQPLIENAIEHAWDRHKMLEIHVRSVTSNNSVAIEVIDNGVGIDERQIRSLGVSSGDEEFMPCDHVGLANVHRRLQLAFGSPYGLNIERRLTGGTCASLVIPIEGMNTDASNSHR